MPAAFTRREVLKMGGVLTAGTVLGNLGARLSAGPSPRPRPAGAVLRVAHLTDIHVRPDDRSARGLASCLRHVHSLDDRPDLILNGGDAIMDALGADEERARRQWEVWQRVLRDEGRVPIEHCVGNHDVWGWGRRHSKATGRDPLYGKRWAVDVFGLERSYRSFDRAGWHFAVLDSTHPHGAGYQARLDDEQFEWLRTDLKGTLAATPVLVLSHIPI